MMRVGVKSDVGRIRSTNEDHYGVLPYLLAVADGMGGVQAGEIASEMVIETLSVYPFREDDPGASLTDAVRKANAAIYRKASSSSDLQGMGTTVTAAYIRAEAAFIAQVGDSRAYLIRDGEIRLLTQDHSLVGELLRNGSITPEEAMWHPQRNLLTRALGTAPDVEVDLLRLQLMLDDVLILCTDGLTNAVSDEEIKDEIMRHSDPQSAAEALVDTANARGGNDNCTVIVAHILPPLTSVSDDLQDTIELDSLLFAKEEVYSY